MFKKITTSIALVSVILLVGATTASAGSLTPPGAPARTMYTLDDFYNKLTNFTTTSSGSSGSLTAPGTVVGTFHTLSDIYSLLSAQNSNLVAGNIKSGTTIFGIAGSLAPTLSYGDASAAKVLTIASSAGTFDASNLSVGNVRSGVAYGVGLTGTVIQSLGNAIAANVLSTATFSNATGANISGTMPVKTADNAVTSGTVLSTSLKLTPPIGYYDGTATVSTTSPYFIAGNIASGVNLFGITGTLAVLNTSDATAAVSDILSPKTAYVNGVKITGTMPTNTLSSANDTVAAGYYAATTLSAVDTNLAAGNIKSGTTIFGKVGSLVANLYGDLSNAAKVLTTASSPGTYNAANLSAGTVLAGTTFGVSSTGTVIQSLGNAIAANVLSTATFSNATGANISGTMPTNTLSSANDTVAAGYYAATTLSAVDTNLAAGNIKSGTAIFGKVGTVIQSLGNATVGTVLSGTTFSNATAANLTGTIPLKTSDNAVTGGTVQSTTLKLTPPTGYYDGTATVSTTSPVFIAGNIKSGVNLFGIAGSLVANLYGDLSNAANVLTTASSPGTYNAANLSAGTVLSGTAFGVSQTGTVIQSLGNAIAANVLSTATFSNASAAGLTGTIPVKTLDNAVTGGTVLGTSLKLTPPLGYYDGTATVSTTSPYFIAGNIKSGVNLFGIAGTAAGAQLLKTNQTICYDTSGAVVTCGTGTGAGQDGAYLKGAARSYTDNANGTVTDNSTGLMWEQCSEGLSGAGCTTGTAATYTWALALTQCEGSTANGYSDWRLPNVYELYSLVDFGVATYPFINGTYFPVTQSSSYWSSTTYPAPYTYAMGVNFGGGGAFGNGKAASYNVRCVRG